MSSPRYAEVAVARRVRGRGRAGTGDPVRGLTLHYEIPDLLGQLRPGHLVEVPLGSGRVRGIVVALAEASPVAETKPVRRILDPVPALLPAQLDLARWISREYLSHLLDCLHLMLPPGGLEEMLRRPLTRKMVRLRDRLDRSETERAVEKAPKQRQALERLRRSPSGELPMARLGSSAARGLERKGLVEIHSLRVQVVPPSPPRVPPDRPPQLTPAQALALARIFTASPGSAHLLHGVTGSGKTEVYLQAASRVLAEGKRAIVLVPEIALTPQTLERFAARFPSGLAVTHSQLGPRQRAALWRQVRAGKVDVVIGPRSALFGPMEPLGLIVLDEEHDASYKEDPEDPVPRPRYHAREVAMELARLTGARLVLGSATPDLVTYHRAQERSISLLELPQRILTPQADGRFAFGTLPAVEMVDLRAELRLGNRGPFSARLATALEETLAAGGQAILFLNRRGTSTAVVCRECGKAMECEDCSIPLTYHGTPRPQTEQLECHHCGRRYVYPSRCPHCSSGQIRHFGMGTKRLEEEVRRLFPSARTLRWDRDAVERPGEHERIFRRFRRVEANVLVGTQMVTKGLDLPLVTLVGVVNADIALHLPDYRAPERTFQLLTQVAGRAGRSRLGGRVIIQTFSPDHYALRAAQRHDYLTFYGEELARRRALGYPPFARLIRLTYHDRSEVKAEGEAERMGALLRERGLPGVEVTGPAPAFFHRVRGHYRWQLFLRGERPQRLLEGVDFRLGWRIDVDPVSSL